MRLRRGGAPIWGLLRAQPWPPAQRPHRPLVAQRCPLPQALGRLAGQQAQLVGGAGVWLIPAHLQRDQHAKRQQLRQGEGWETSIDVGAAAAAATARAPAATPNVEMAEQGARHSAGLTSVSISPGMGRRDSRPTIAPFTFDSSSSIDACRQGHGWRGLKLSAQPHAPPSAAELPSHLVALGIGDQHARMLQQGSAERLAHLFGKQGAAGQGRGWTGGMQHCHPRQRHQLRCSPRTMYVS